MGNPRLMMLIVLTWILSSQTSLPQTLLVSVVSLVNLVVGMINILIKVSLLVWGDSQQPYR